MIKIFKTFHGRVEIAQPEKNCWINIVDPSEREIEKIIREFGVPRNEVADILDQDERTRLEIGPDYILIILRIPIDTPRNGVPFNTIPLGIFITGQFTITICSMENDVLSTRKNLPVSEINHDTMGFVLNLFYRTASLYMKALKQINQMTVKIEQDLEKSIKNEELNKLLKMEKCLVYFITSLKSNEIVLIKLKNSKKIPFEIDEDIMEDVLIENKQALETAQIYSDIQSGMMDAFASVISNNVNDVMKQLTIISIILMIPTLIASFFGMNVPNILEQSHWGMTIIFIGSIIISLLGVAFVKKRDWF